MRTLSRPATSSQRRRQWVETEDELDGIKQTVPAKRGFVRSTLSSFRSLPPSLNFPPALFTTHRRVTFSKLLRLLYSHACLFSCYAVLLSRLCENPLRIHVHFLALSSLFRLFLSLIYSFGRVKFCGFKLPVRATLSISDIRHARVKLAFSCIS